MHEYIPAIKKGVKTLAIILFIGYLALAVFALLQYYSINSSMVSIMNPSFDIGVNDPLDKAGLVDILSSRPLEVEADLQIEGNGILPFEVRSVQAKVYLENIYLGDYTSNDGFRVPAQGVKNLHINLGIDGDQMSPYKMEQIATAIIEHNGEVNISVKALMEPKIISYPLTMTITDSDYVLSYNDGPQVTSLSWDDNSCNLGENASFTVATSNVFRYSNVTGVLDITITEDNFLRADPKVENFSYQLSLKPGESLSFSDSFTPYKMDSTIGFYLTAMWGVDLIKEQDSDYPPRLQVIEGDLELLEIYWTVEDVRTHNCTVGDEVEAHIRIKAVNAGVDEEIVVKIKKDQESTPDQDILTRSHQTVLRRDEETEKIIRFTPSETSYPVIGGYYVEINGDLNWTMPEGSPPRLSVSPLQGNLTLTEAWWSKDEKNITSAETGDTVNAQITVAAEGGPVTGNILVNIKRDHVSTIDEVIESESFPVSLGEDEEETFTVSFTASEASGSEFRGYYIEVLGGLQWEMNSSYPPRLNVTETVSVSFPLVQSAWWSVEGFPITVATQGEPVQAVVRIKSVDGKSEGTVYVYVRKEFRYMSDEDQTIRSFEIDLEENDHVDIMTTFTPEDQSGFIFVGYYIYVDFESWGKSWTMNTAYPPRLEVI